MKPSYCEKNVQTLVKMIKEGSTSEDIKNVLNIKTNITIFNWLDRFYTRKKALVKKYYNMLLENNKKANYKTTFEAWYGDDTPEVDCIIDCNMSYYMQKVAIKFCTKMNFSYKISKKTSFITVQSILLGKPTVISDSENVRKYSALDDILFISIYDLMPIHTFVCKAVSISK